MTDYLDDELAAGSRRRVDRHLRLCPSCRTVVGNLRVTLARLAQLGRAETSDGDAEVAARLRRGWRRRA